MIQEKNILISSFILGGYLNIIFLMIILSTMAHPNIINRILSGCPLFYLFTSEDIIFYLNNYKTHKMGLILIIICFWFTCIGVLLQVGMYGFA